MRILIVSPSLNPDLNTSGISSVVRFIINNNKKHQYFHFELGKKDNVKRSFAWFWGVVKVYLSWFEIILKKRADLIHFNLSLNYLSLLRDIPLIFLARLFDRDILIHFHGGKLLMGKVGFIMRPLIKYLVSGNYPKIVLSQSEKVVFQERFNCTKIYVLQNCIETDKAQEFTRIFKKGKELYLLFLGRITEQKGLAYLFEAFVMLKREHVAFKFFLAGAGPDEREYVKKFQDLLIGDFEFKGVVSGVSKYKLLQEADVFLLPSFYEGLPMALLESMSFGLVPITTNVGAMGDVVNNDHNGIIVQPRSAEDIAWAIKKIVNDFELFKRLSINSRKTILSQFRTEVYFTELNKIYGLVRSDF